MPDARGQAGPLNGTAVAPATRRAVSSSPGCCISGFLQGRQYFHFFLLESLLCPVSNPAPGTGFQPL